MVGVYVRSRNGGAKDRIMKQYTVVFVLTIGCIESFNPFDFKNDNCLGCEDTASSDGECAEVAIESSTAISSCFDIDEASFTVISRLETLWGSKPAFICAYNSYNSLSSCLSVPNDAYYCFFDDSISWDFNFLNGLYVNYGEAAFNAFIAHEWGHLNQRRAGLLGANGSTKALELHADCQAGMFMAFEYDSGRISLDDIEATRVFFSDIGEAYLSSWGDVGSHGTGTERVQAFDVGFTNALENLPELCVDDPIALMRLVCG